MLNLRFLKRGSRITDATPLPLPPLPSYGQNGNFFWEGLVRSHDKGTFGGDRDDFFYGGGGLLGKSHKKNCVIP